MESGTILHLALLRKTSKAQKKKKPIITHIKIKQLNQQISIRKKLDDVNFTLSGWGLQEYQTARHLKRQKSAKNNRVCLSLPKDNQKIVSSRSYPKQPLERQPSFSHKKLHLCRPIQNITVKEHNCSKFNLITKENQHLPHFNTNFQPKDEVHWLKQNHQSIQYNLFDKCFNRGSEKWKKLKFPQAIQNFNHNNGFGLQKFFKI